METDFSLSEFDSTVNLIVFTLIVICAASGSAMPYVRAERDWNFPRWFIEFITSCAAGFIVYLILRTSKLSWEWIGACSGVSSYFGLKIMNTLYGIVTGKLKLTVHNNGANHGN